MFNPCSELIRSPERNLNLPLLQGKFCWVPPENCRALIGSTTQLGRVNEVEHYTLYRAIFKIIPFSPILVPKIVPEFKGGRHEGGGEVSGTDFTKPLIE